MRRPIAALAALLALASLAPPARAADSVSTSLAGPCPQAMRPARERFAADEGPEVPDFQRHVLPLMGRLGCNGRACHGSFQGAGGFRLSLFGYDFAMDHDALLAKDAGRVDPELPEGSKILQKPTLGIPHKGGKRMEEGGWEYNLLYRWIAGGAKGVTKKVAFERLEVTPREIVFERDGQQVPLNVVAVWADGTREDVTCITRFRTNDESVAEVDADGMVTCQGRGDTHVIAFYDNGVAATQVLRPVSDRVGPDYPDVPTPTPIDRHVVAKLRKLGIVPSEVCTDAEFLRRANLDLTGTLPTPEEVEAFLADRSADKRARKVDELLDRPTYAAWWATKLCDITGNSPRNLQGQTANAEMSRQWYDWLRRRVAENTPYDDLIAGIVLATSRKPGQSYEDYVREQTSYFRAKDPADFTARETMPYYWARRNLRKPDEKALNFSYAFLGVRLECAQCHKHPFDQWTQDDFNRFTAFFTGVGYGLADTEARQASRQIQKESGLDAIQGAGNKRKAEQKLIEEGKVVPWQEVFARMPRVNQANGARAKKGKGGKDDAKDLTPRVLGGDAVALSTYDDPREPLMEWMRKANNPYFARAFINRVWDNYFGSGIVNPPDDMNLANPPSNEALLDYLADGFVSRGYDMKWLHREILTSQTYQRSWQPNETNRLDERNFSRALVRRLPAEVLLDAVTMATAAPEAVAAFTTDVADRAIGPVGGPRGRGGNASYAARVFGQSTRDTNCDCSRSDEPNLLQAIYLQNDQDLLSALDRKGGWLATLIAESRKRDQDKGKQEAEVVAGPSEDADALIVRAYLRTLSRPPVESELARARAYLGSARDVTSGVRDVLWALLNTKEFMTNH